MRHKSRAKNKSVGPVPWVIPAVPALFLALVLALWSPLWAGQAPRVQSPWFLDMNQYAAGAHFSLSCQQCHPQMEDQGKKHPEATSEDLQKDAARIYDYAQCRICHQPAWRRCQQGAHAEALVKEKEARSLGREIKAGVNRAPTCGDCHQAHYARSHLSRVETGKNMMAVCGVCHQAQLATYLADYHGKAAVNLGREDAAFCTDCHGAHQALSLKDKTVALAACRRCHREAPPGLADYVVHPTLKNRELKDSATIGAVTVIRAVTAIAAGVVILIIVLYYSHTLLWILREIHDKLRKHGK